MLFQPGDTFSSQMPQSSQWRCSRSCSTVELRDSPPTAFVLDLSDGSWLLVEAGKGFQGGLGFGQGH